MRVGFVGLGTFGLPMAVAVASRGHRVRGYDSLPSRMALDWYPRGGEPLDAIAPRCDFAFAPLDAVVDAQVVFVTVQTPSRDGYAGTTPFPPGGVDYDLQPLRRALAQVRDAVARQPGAERVLAVVSTILPGTLRRLARELDFPSGVSLAHAPAFAAVGRFIADTLAPEFALVGAFDQRGARQLELFFRSTSDAPVFVTTPENAELIKTSYNGFIGLKIGFANALMELAHKLPGCDVDTVADCLSLATGRLASARYLRGGLGDGGGCHPKENAALASLAARLELSFDPFGANMASRDRQNAWLAGVIEDEVRRSALPLWILGTAFKANVASEFGSAALLLMGELERRGLRPRAYDPLVAGRDAGPPREAAVFVLAAPHDALLGFRPAHGSVVVDPWRRFPPQAGVRIVAIGRGPAAS